jgi:hypothetical protein
MHWDSWDKFFWLTGAVGHVALLYVLFAKSRWRMFPWFTLLIANELVQSVSLLLLYRCGCSLYNIYFRSYWSFEIVDAIFRIVVIAELVARAYRTLSKDGLALAGELIALILILLTGYISLTAQLGPQFDSTPIKIVLRASMTADALTISASLILLCWTIFTGLSLSTHMTTIASGMVGFVMAKLGSRWLVSAYVIHRWHTLENSLKLVYLVILATWCIVLWRNGKDLRTNRIVSARTSSAACGDFRNSLF